VIAIAGSKSLTDFKM